MRTPEAEAMTSDDVRALMRLEAKPNPTAWATANGLHPSYVSDVLSGRRDPSPSILDVLELEKVVTYRRKSDRLRTNKGTT